MKFIKNLINKINAAKAAKQKNAENRLFNEGFGLAARGIFCSIKLNGHFSLEDDQESAVLYDACKNSDKPFDRGVVAAFDKFCDMNEKFNLFVETVAGIHWKRCDAPNENTFVGEDTLEALYPADKNGNFQSVALVGCSYIEAIPTLACDKETLKPKAFEPYYHPDLHDEGDVVDSLPEGYTGPVKVLCNNDRVMGVFPNTEEAMKCASNCTLPTGSVMGFGGYGSAELLPASVNEVTHQSANDWFMG